MGNLEDDLKLVINWDFDGTRSSLQIDKIKEQLQNLLHKNKQTYKPHVEDNTKQEVIENEAFQNLLQCLGLENYFPKRMGRANFHLICKTSVYRTHSSFEQELPISYRYLTMVQISGFQRRRTHITSGLSSTSDKENEVPDP